MNFVFNIYDNNIYFCKENFIVVENVVVVCMYRCLINSKFYVKYINIMIILIYIMVF